MSSALRLLIVADQSHEQVISRLLDQLPIDTCWLSSPDQAALAALEDALGLPTIADVRAAGARDDLDAVCIMSRQPLLDDEWASLRRASRPTFVTEAIHVASLDDSDVRFAPRYCSSDALRQVRQTIEEFGEPRAINMVMLSDPTAGSIGARLYDALDAIVHIAGSPIESIHGRFNGTVRGSLPDSPTAVDGRITATFRLESGIIGNLFVSNVNGPWTRGCLLMCDEGIITADDHTSRWQPREHDTCELQQPTNPSTIDEHLADRMLALLDDQPAEPPPHRRDIFAAWLACWLSCRTGQVEYAASMPVG